MIIEKLFSSIDTHTGGEPTRTITSGIPFIPGDTIAKKMEDEKVFWIKSNKSAGSRIVGLDLLRQRMKASIDGEGAGIYFMNNCLASIATLPIMSRDPNNPEDVLKGADDHAYDEIRYRVLHGNVRSATKITIKQVI